VTCGLRLRQRMCLAPVFVRRPDRAAGEGATESGRHVIPVEQLRAALDRLKTGEVDAYFYVGDVMVVSQAQLIVDTANAKRLPTMFHERGIVAKGALAGYGVNYREVGRSSAKHIQRVLTGTSPEDLPIENADKARAHSEPEDPPGPSASRSRPPSCSGRIR
jgi:hypothetical protein